MKKGMSKSNRTNMTKSLPTTPLQAMGISGRVTPVAMDGWMTDSAPTPNTTQPMVAESPDKKRVAEGAADTMTLVSMPQTSSGTGSWQYIQKSPSQRLKIPDAAKAQSTSHGISSSWSVAQSPIATIPIKLADFGTGGGTLPIEDNKAEVPRNAIMDTKEAVSSAVVLPGVRDGTLMSQTPN